MSKVVMKRRIPVIIILILALSVVFSTACSKNTNTANSTTSNASQTFPGLPSSGSTGGTTASSPTASLKAYTEAMNKKDFETVKRYLSLGSMKVMEDEAKRRGKSLDEAFKEASAQAPSAAVVPEFSNEKISGDSATVDMTAQGQTVTMPMVKEGGEWKLAVDKLIENLKNSAGGGASEPEGGDDDDHGGGHDEK